MRQILVDELSREERANLETYLKRTVTSGLLEGVFWLELPPDLWGEAQQGHTDCGPFSFSIVLDENKIVFELLVRSRTNLHCSCISYATEAQRLFLLRFIDRMLEEERISA